MYMLTKFFTKFFTTHEQELIDIKTEIDKTSVIVGDFNTLPQ